MFDNLDDMEQSDSNSKLNITLEKDNVKENSLSSSKFGQVDQDPELNLVSPRLWLKGRNQGKFTYIFSDILGILNAISVILKL